MPLVVCLQNHRTVHVLIKHQRPPTNCKQRGVVNKQMNSCRLNRSLLVARALHMLQTLVYKLVFTGLSVTWRS